MRFELKLSSAYISYFLQILLQFSLSLSFHLSFIYYFNFEQRIECRKERFDFLFPHGSLAQFILSALAVN